MPQTIYCVQWVIFLISSLQWQVTSVKQMSMANNHFKVGAHTWAPLLDIKKDERGDDTISGPFGDYLRYIMEARNCTFTIVTPPDGKWGNCNGSENCTGVIGLVARREVDFAINPFTMTLDRKEGVDFTRPVQSSAYTVVMPVKTKPKRWFFINPFPANLWILYISTIPIYFLAMVLVYYLCHWSVEWEATGSFVLRVALIEHSSPTNDLGRMFQQKLLIIILNLCFMVLTYSYAGNLTAMFTKPKLQGPIRSLNELLDQNAVPWVLEAGSFLETLMSTAPPNSTTKKIQERSKRMSLIVSSSGCYSDELEKSLEFGAICALEDFKTLSNKVFSEIGKCKFYAVKERFLNTRNALAIQKKSPYLEDLNNIIDMSHATGFSKLTNDDFLPYGKSCLTWQDVKASHDAEDGQVVIRLEEVFGMLIILFVGLSGAAVIMALECLVKRTRINLVNDAQALS